MREDNIAMLNDTLSILETGYYLLNGDRIDLKLTRPQMEEVQVYLPDRVYEISQSRDFDHTHVSDRCEYNCVREDSYTHARKLTDRYADAPGSQKPVLVLNLANPVNPGGGVLKGSRAQEEDLCRKSSLFLSLTSDAASAYYRYNKSLKTYMGSHAVMIHPQVEIIKDENGELLPESVIVAVMTCAAPALHHGKEGMTEKQYEQMIYDRIAGMLKVAAYLGYDKLVLGAFGCGAFLNDARVVSGLFYKALKEFDYDGMKDHDMFRQIDFAVLDHSYDQHNFNAFSRYFNHFYEIDESPEGKPAEQLQIGPNSYDAVFFHKTDEPFGFLSNWYPSTFLIDGIRYTSAEQYIMYQKCKLLGDDASAQAILDNDDVAAQQAIGRNAKGYINAVWSGARQIIAFRGLMAKFSQNEDLKQQLLDTGNAYLVECARSDKVWACGRGLDDRRRSNADTWDGQNILGFALMEVRSRLK